MLARYPDSCGAVAIEVMATHSSKPRETLYLFVGIYSIAAKVPAALKYGHEHPPELPMWTTAVA